MSDLDEMADALEAAGLLQAEYPDQMAQRSCTCEPEAICGAHRLLARYEALLQAFKERGVERRAMQQHLIEIGGALNADTYEETVSLVGDIITRWRQRT